MMRVGVWRRRLRYFPGQHGETYDLASTLEAVDASLTRLALECAMAGVEKAEKIGGRSRAAFF